MEFKEGKFVAESLADISSFARFLGGYEFLSFANPLNDDKGHVLIQSGRPLRPKQLEALQNRGLPPDYKLVLAPSDALSGAISSRIMNAIQAHLKLQNFSFAGYLLNECDVDMFQVVRKAVSNIFFMQYITLLMYEKKPIVEHLFEVGLTCVGFLGNMELKELKLSHYTNMFMAGIFHDYSISSLASWEDHENFQDPDGHDDESADLLKEKGLPPDVPAIIATNNQLSKVPTTGEDGVWKTELLVLMGAILNIIEYYTYYRRYILKEGSDLELNEAIMYEIGIRTEKQFFPRYLKQLFEKFFKKYKRFSDYGAAIGKVEHMCPHGENIALAYPKPKATQVLCTNSNIECRHRLMGQPINIVQVMNPVNSRIGRAVNPGFYDKCQFTNELPPPPAKL